MFLYEYKMERGIAMDSRVESYFEDIKGKKIAFLGIGGSNLPLAKIFRQKGAIVFACDKREKEQLGKTGEELAKFFPTCSKKRRVFSAPHNAKIKIPLCASPRCESSFQPS